jgi:hypothetical protein
MPRNENNSEETGKFIKIEVLLSKKKARQGKW